VAARNRDISQIAASFSKKVRLIQNKVMDTETLEKFLNKQQRRIAIMALKQKQDLKSLESKKKSRTSRSQRAIEARQIDNQRRDNWLQSLIDKQSSKQENARRIKCEYIERRLDVIEQQKNRMEDVKRNLEILYARSKEYKQRIIKKKELKEKALEILKLQKRYAEAIVNRVNKEMGLNKLMRVDNPYSMLERIGTSATNKKLLSHSIGNLHNSFIN